MILFFIIFSLNFVSSKSEDLEYSGSASEQDYYYEISESNNRTETDLRVKLFKNYNSVTRPVYDYHDSVKVNFTLMISKYVFCQELQYFYGLLYQQEIFSIIG